MGTPGPSSPPSPTQTPVQIFLDLLRIHSSLIPSPNPVQTSQLKGLFVENSVHDYLSKLFLEFVGGLKSMIQYINRDVYFDLEIIQNSLNNTF